VGGIAMGRLADRFGVMLPVLLGAVGLGAGFIAPAWRRAWWLFCWRTGCWSGCSAPPPPSRRWWPTPRLWFDRRRGIALAICMSGNYTAGAVWPPVMQHFIDVGWRQTYIGLGVFCLASILPLAVPAARGRRRRRRAGGTVTEPAVGRDGQRPFGLSPNGCCARCCAWPASPAAWRCRCRRCTSWRTAATWASARRAAPRCCR
jgi:MFS family permease